MKKIILASIIVIVSCTLVFAGNSGKKKTGVLPGADLLLKEQFSLIKGKTIGIITNHSALLSNGVHLVDTLFARKDVKIGALFGPEHGIRGDAPDGKSITHGKDSKTGVEVYSLYGKIRKPTPEMLKGIDVLVFDIQDIGARFYTFISTLYYGIEAAAENKIPIIVLDRPNPITGEKVDGPVRKDDQVSFVGIAPIPVMHGMTVGELSELFNNSGMLPNGLKADLKVIKVENWKRSSYFDEVKLPWLKPSPNIPDIETAIVYPGMCLIEGTNVSEGRGTYAPFLTFGAPFVDSDKLIRELEKMDIKGVRFEAVDFTPVEIPNMVSNPKFQGQLCHGVKLHVTDRKALEPVKLGIKVVYALNKLFPEGFAFNNGRFDKLSGDTKIRESIASGKTAEEIISGWQKELESFKSLRNKFLLY